MILEYVKFIVSVFFLFYGLISVFFFHLHINQCLFFLSFYLLKEIVKTPTYIQAIRQLLEFLTASSLTILFYINFTAPNLIFYHTSPRLALVLFLEYTNLVSLCLCLSLSKYFIWLTPLTFHNSAQILLLRDFLPTPMESAFYLPTLHSLALHLFSSCVYVAC